MNIKLNYIKAREILDSRGRPTVEVEISVENPNFKGLEIKAFGVSPSGASCGKFEAHELRDEEEGRFLGFGVQKAVNYVNNDIRDLFFNEKIDITNQFEIDKALIALDGTENKSNFGANALIAVSLAFAKLNSSILNIPLWKHINNLINDSRFKNSQYITPRMPDPFVNIINGGLHADNNLAIQEFMIVPSGINGFKEKIRACCEVFGFLKKNLKDKNYNINVGDEGGFAPNLYQSSEALSFLEESIKKAGYEIGIDFVLALDVAASSFFKDNHYLIDEKELNEDQMIDYLINLCKKFPIVSIEDPLNEESYEFWKILTQKFDKKKDLNVNKVFGEKKIRIVGDDLFVTNPKLFTFGIEQKMANTILIKPNQIGTLTETLDVICLAIKNQYKYIISHRSGESEDNFISHLSVGTAAFGIKTGSVCRSERTSKYNELIRIEEELKKKS